MPFRSLRAAVPLLLCLSFAMSASAQPAEPLIAEFPPDREVCYGRVYDGAHLAGHPRQQVTSINLYRSLTHDPRLEVRPQTKAEISQRNVDWERMTRADDPEMEGTRRGRTSLDVLVAFRNRSGVFRQTLECRKLNGEGFTCGVDCDGGGFGARSQGTSLMLRQSKHTGGLRVQSGCSSGDESAPEVRIEPNDDQLAFRLDPLPMAACHAVRDASRPEWARIEGPSLRERFAASENLCFRSSAAMSARKGQPISRLSVLTRGKLRQTNDEDQSTELEIRISALLTTGRRIERDLTCRGEDYSFMCSVENGGSLRLTKSRGNALTVRETYYEGGEIARLLGLGSILKVPPIELTGSNIADCGGRAR